MPVVKSAPAAWPVDRPDGPMRDADRRCSVQFVVPTHGPLFMLCSVRAVSEFRQGSADNPKRA